MVSKRDRSTSAIRRSWRGAAFLLGASLVSLSSVGTAVAGYPGFKDKLMGAALHAEDPALRGAVATLVKAGWDRRVFDLAAEGDPAAGASQPLDERASRRAIRGYVEEHFWFFGGEDPYYQAPAFDEASGRWLGDVEFGSQTFLRDGEMWPREVYSARVALDPRTGHAYLVSFHRP